MAQAASPDELLMAVVLGQDDHLRWPGHLSPSSGHDFRELKSILIGGELCDANLAVLLSEESESIEPSPMIQCFRVVRDKDQLAAVLFDSSFGGEQPGLNFAQGDEVVRFVYKDGVSLFDGEVQNHVERDETPLAFGQLRNGVTDPLP